MFLHTPGDTTALLIVVVNETERVDTCSKTEDVASSFTRRRSAGATLSRRDGATCSERRRSPRLRRRRHGGPRRRRENAPGAQK